VVRAEKEIVEERESRNIKRCPFVPVSVVLAHEEKVSYAVPPDEIFVFRRRHLVTTPL
jgi:hypothetical protein